MALIILVKLPLLRSLDDRSFLELLDGESKPLAQVLGGLRSQVEQPGLCGGEV